ncbi:dTMP kinase [Herbihabitans rhizosphaerae]|uniref:Thymidylate kinase n=1 Tax=Herbihabitans rhizosphaerae TaxID=1872711 RepID=A0A4Q7KGJ0_9PSEU|nr:dTMP kinase [Herbihabitans rhizosphaerae]RZS33968.1 dTMP kinase [Herbihabitans rhizosphaerae]
MGRLIVIEGLDGAGKRTMSDGLTGALERRGARVVRRAFPRYDEDVHAALIKDALHGRLGDLGESAHGMAVLFALDRLGAKEKLAADRASADVVLLDRYIASNAAYLAARLRQSAAGEGVTWVRELEIDRFGIPVPDAQILLRVPSDVAAARAERRAREETDRERDTWESDGGLQARVEVVYEDLAAASWLSPWQVVDGLSTVDFDALTVTLLGGSPG